MTMGLQLFKNIIYIFHTYLNLTMTMGLQLLLKF